MQRWETLYTLDSKGKIRVFECKVEKEGEYYNIITQTGILGGKLIIQKELVKKGKQNRSVKEQAEFQAESLWVGKYDEGYKDHLTLTHKTDIDPRKTYTLEEHLKLAFKQNPNACYTNSEWDELPMLAHKFKDIKNPNYPYFVQPKLNGVRALVKLDPLDGSVKIISRGGQYYRIPHLENELEDLFDCIDQATQNQYNFILDGEVYRHGIPLQEISGAARKEETGLFTTNSWLEYHIYDVIDITKLDESFAQRFITQCGLHLMNKGKHIKFVFTMQIENKEELEAKHKQFLADGYEGTILRDRTAEYKFNQRSRGLLKYKEFQDEEFEVIGSEVDPNKSIEESFVFILKNNINDLIFKCRPTGSNEMKKHWYKNIHKYIGMKATVRFFERSNDGIPTHGNLRHKDCPLLVEHIRPQDE